MKRKTRAGMLSQRKARLQARANSLGLPVECLPDYFTTPEMIAIALGKYNGNQSLTARELGISLNTVRYYDPRKQLPKS